MLIIIAIFFGLVNKIKYVRCSLTMSKVVRRNSKLWKVFWTFWLRIVTKEIMLPKNIYNKKSTSIESLGKYICLLMMFDRSIKTMIKTSYWGLILTLNFNPIPLLLLNCWVSAKLAPAFIVLSTILTLRKIFEIYFRKKKIS